jgi:hypothetical protein
MAWLPDRDRKAARHRSSHSGLLTPVPDGRLPGDVDAVVVPTNRPIRYLSEAIALAQSLSCPILVLCSGQSRAAGAGALFESAVGVALTVSSTPRHPLLSLRTQRLLSSLAEPYLDTGNKRNVALLLGRLMGWQRLLFLDDDIRELTADQVRQAASALAPNGMHVVGWKFFDFPDNSVACHALRASGARQDVFIGAGALLVELTSPVPFFPPVYNEDWLFCHDSAVRRQLGLAGEVKQLDYDPFDDPHRARQQEFGDVLAEGLYALIHDRRSVLIGSLPGYWHEVIAQRQAMLARLDGRLWHLRRRRTRTWDGHEIGRVLRSVAASREALDLLTAEDFAEFVGAWRYDLYRWNARLHGLPRFSRITDALSWLGITDVYLSGIL